MATVTPSPLYLDTTPDHFEAWLLDATRHHRQWERIGGRVESQAACRGRPRIGSLRFEIPGILSSPFEEPPPWIDKPGAPYCILKSDGSGHAIYELTLIAFDVVPLAPARIKVTLAEVGPSADEWADELIAGMRVAWPEAGPAEVSVGEFVPEEASSAHAHLKPWQAEALRLYPRNTLAEVAKKVGLHEDTVKKFFNDHRAKHEGCPPMKKGRENL